MTDKAPAPPPWPRGPSALRALAVVGVLVAGTWVAGSLAEDGKDPQVTSLGQVEVTARLVGPLDPFPQTGHYKYTYVLKYRVLTVHRQAPDARHQVRAGDVIYVGHYRPMVPRSEAKDADWGDRPLGGRLVRFEAGEAHRMALAYELMDVAPGRILDYCDSPGKRRFFALWTNPTAY